MGFHLGGRRKFRLQAGHNCVHALQRQNHVGLPVKVQIDLGRTAARYGCHFLETRNAVHGFFDGTSDGDQHLVDGHYAVVHTDDNAGKVRIRKNGNGDRKR